MKERFAKLLTVKSIVTVVLTAVFAVLALTGVVTGEQFLTVFTVVISFYFGTQHEKKIGGGMTAPQSASQTAPLTRGALESVPVEGNREEGVEDV